MKSFNQYLITEKRDLSVPIITKGKKRKWFRAPLHILSNPDTDVTKDVFDLIQKTYEPIGGHIDFKAVSDIPSDFSQWLVVDIDKDPELDAVTFGKGGPGGLKLTGTATDGSAAAKKVMLNKINKLLRTKGNYGEVSGAIAHVLIKKYKIPYVDSEERVQQLLPGKKFTWVGANPNGKYPDYVGWYERNLGGSGKLKIMVGNPN
jgi:hypothetical protein